MKKGIVKITEVEVVRGVSAKRMKAGQAKPTKVMKAIGFTWVDVTEMVNHCVNLLEEEGKTALDVVRGIMTLVQAVSERDFTTIFIQLNKTKADVTEIIAAIKKEFDLE